MSGSSPPNSLKTPGEDRHEERDERERATMPAKVMITVG